jgi:hypothetical protein
VKRYELLYVAIATLFLASSVPAEPPRLTRFLITIEPTEDGVSMSCSEGCAWKTLAVGGCTPADSCRFSIDQGGMI